MRRKRCIGSGHLPAFGRCPICGRGDLAITSRGRLRAHVVAPVDRGVFFDERRRQGRGEWVAAVQTGSVMNVYGGRNPAEAHERARQAFPALNRKERTHA